MQRRQTIAGVIILACLLIGTAILVYSDQQVSWVRAYGGDAVATILIYFCLRLAFPNDRNFVPLLTLCIAFTLELGQILWQPYTGQTSLPAIVFGATFDWIDIFVYLGSVAICRLGEAFYI